MVCNVCFNLQDFFERARVARESSTFSWSQRSSPRAASSMPVISSGRASRISSSSSISTLRSGMKKSVAAGDPMLLDDQGRQYWGKAEGMMRKAYQEVLDKCDVVCATCAGAGDSALDNR